VSILISYGQPSNADSTHAPPAA